MTALVNPVLSVATASCLTASFAQLISRLVSYYSQRLGSVIALEELRRRLAPGDIAVYRMQPTRMRCWATWFECILERSQKDTVLSLLVTFPKMQNADLRIV